jgi:uncharacterized protein YkwD
VARTLSLLLVIASLTSLAIAPGASAAAGLGDQRIVAKPKRTPPANRSATAAATPLIAPTTTCPGQNGLDASVETQVWAMRCMTDYARAQIGLPPLADVAALDASSQAKGHDVIVCDDFSHTACGRQFTYWIEQSGYFGSACWHTGENLAWGMGEQGTARSIFQAWMRSPAHRQNILGSYSDLGVSLEVGSLGNQPGTRIWTQHFGSRCAV